MFYPRYKKVIRDLLSNKGRTILVILAIAVGVFSFGSVFITRTILLKQMETQYIAINPSSITMFFSNFDNGLSQWMKRQPEINEVQARSEHVFKFEYGTRKENIGLFAYKDYPGIKLNYLKIESGKLPPGKDEVVLERATLKWLNAKIGDTIIVELTGNRTRYLTVTGSVHDLNSIPPNFMLQGTGYISWSTISELGFDPAYNQLLISLKPSYNTLNKVQDVANMLKSRLEDTGTQVQGIRVEKPNEHWAQDVMKAFITILEGIGIFSLLLSGFLVITTITGLITQQKQQIGIMKAVGARVPQVTGLYLVTVIVYGFLALIIAVPVGMVLAYFNMQGLVNFLNLKLPEFYLPTEVLILEIIAAMLVPVISAFIPILSGARITVREAIYSYEVRTGKTSFANRITQGFVNLPRPLLLSFRNIFRRKGRLILTLSTLTLGGAFFICVLNVQQSLQEELNKTLRKINFDLQLSLDKTYPIDYIERKVASINGVAEVEGRTGAQAQYVKIDGSLGSTFPISGLPYNSTFIEPVLKSGSWVTPGKNTIVLSSELVKNEPEIEVGKTITLDFNGLKSKWIVTGVIFSTFGDTTAYTDIKQLAIAQDKEQEVASLFVKASERTPEFRKQLSQNIETAFKSWDISITQSLTRDMLAASIGDRIAFLVNTLLFMAILISLVGGLGLAGTMSLNILERTREIGVMRSIGASNLIIRLLVIAEGIFIGLISFVISVPLSAPISYGFDYILGASLFQSPLSFVYTITGPLVWLIVIILISVIASLLSARRAVNLSVRETLAYE